MLDQPAIIWEGTLSGLDFNRLRSKSVFICLSVTKTDGERPNSTTLTEYTYCQYLIEKKVPTSLYWFLWTDSRSVTLFTCTLVSYIDLIQSMMLTYPVSVSARLCAGSGGEVLRSESELLPAAFVNTCFRSQDTVVAGFSIILCHVCWCVACIRILMCM